MKVVICVKPIISKIVNWDTDKDRIINPYDLFVIKEINKLKKDIDVEINCILMSVEDKRIVAELKSLNVDKVTFLSDKAFAGADVYATSLVLTKAIEKIGDVDYIFCGDHAIDGETGHVAPEIAERLGYDYLGEVEKIYINENQVYCDIVNEFIETYLLKSPMVIGFKKCITTEVILSIMQLRKMNKIEYEVWDRDYLGISIQDCGLKGSKTLVKRTKTFNVNNNRKVVKINWNEEIEQKKMLEILKGGRNDF